MKYYLNIIVSLWLMRLIIVGDVSLNLGLKYVEVGKMMCNNCSRKIVVNYLVI